MKRFLSMFLALLMAVSVAYIAIPQQDVEAATRMTSFKVTVSPAQIRATAGTSGKILAVVSTPKTGKPLVYSYRSNCVKIGSETWYNITYNNKSAWISGKYGTLINPVMVYYYSEELAETTWKAYRGKYKYAKNGNQPSGMDDAGIIRVYTGQPYSAKEFYNNAKEKGAISTMPQSIGIMVYKNNRCGIYVGKDSTGKDMVITIDPIKKTATLTGLKSGGWTNWCKVSGVAYKKEGWSGYKYNNALKTYYYKDGEFVTGYVLISSNSSGNLSLEPVSKLYRFGNNGAAIDVKSDSPLIQPKMNGAGTAYRMPTAINNTATITYVDAQTGKPIQGAKLRAKYYSSNIMSPTAVLGNKSLYTILDADTEYGDIKVTDSKGKVKFDSLYPGTYVFWDATNDIVDEFSVQFYVFSLSKTGVVSGNTTAKKANSTMAKFTLDAYNAVLIFDKKSFSNVDANAVVYGQSSENVPTSFCDQDDTVLSPVWNPSCGDITFRVETFDGYVVDNASIECGDKAFILTAEGSNKDTYRAPISSVVKTGSQDNVVKIHVITKKAEVAPPVVGDWCYTSLEPVGKITFAASHLIDNPDYGKVIAVSSSIEYNPDTDETIETNNSIYDTREHLVINCDSSRIYQSTNKNSKVLGYVSDGDNGVEFYGEVGVYKNGSFDRVWYEVKTDSGARGYITDFDGIYTVTRY